MSVIRYAKRHSLGKEKAREIARKITSDFDGKLPVEYRWEGDRLLFERGGVRGVIEVTDEAIEVEVKLGLIYRPLKGQIERHLREFLDAHFDDERDG